VIRSLSGDKRTLSGHRNLVACDPQRHFATSNDAVRKIHLMAPCVKYDKERSELRRSYRAKTSPSGLCGKAKNGRRSSCTAAQRPRFKGQPITWGVTPEGYNAIRRAWLTHVHAEEVLFKPFTEDEFKTQMQVMLSVFTDDCVMELVPAGERWEGHGQAAEFYRVFLSSLEGMKWVPQALVIGPQGVLDVVNMTGKLVKEFAGLKEVGAQVHLQWVIYFPWVPNAGKFKGEVIYSIRPL
jgi:hypothetical protein